MKSLLTVASFFASVVVSSGQVATTVPENLGLGLRQLVETAQSDPAQLQLRAAAVPAMNVDQAGRVLVNIQLNGETALSIISEEVATLGGEVTATDATWRGGIISAWLPIAQAADVAARPGVRSVSLARKPIRRVGSVTAESSVVERAADVNKPGVFTPQGIVGRNISVGIISDSFDAAPNVPRASAGVASGDLPGPGNANGYTQPVVVLKDDGSGGASDEGRAMAEIVHDIAPGAKLCFSTSGATQASMATNIRNLRTSPQTLCDVIVDDIGFADEPFFSDGVISQAVNDVVTSNVLPGKKVAFFSAAGNSDNLGYTADANIISASNSVPYRGNLKFTQVSTSLYAGGFQNLNASGTPAIIMTATTDVDPVELVLQWDDPFNTGGVTTDYNVLVFNQAGNYLSAISGTDNNIATSQPIEITDLAANTTYQIVIALATNSAPAARHLRLISFGGGAVTSPYLTHDTITLTGHPTAANANAVSAYVYSTLPSTVANYNPNKTNPPPGPYEPAFESFSSQGGNVPIYFNAQGQRLTTPELRQKPEFAAADGVDTSFFPPGTGSDYDNNGFPNFFGTSAAAPNAAGFAALLLEAAGGPSSLTPQQVRDKLAQSTFPHDLDPNSSQGSASTFGRVVTVSASGDDSNDSATSPTFFTIAFNGPADSILSEVVIDLSPTALTFDPRADLGFPFTVGRNDSGVSVSSNLSPDQRTLSLSFGNTFTPGKSISFGIDRDLAAISAAGNAADLLAGARFRAATHGTTIYGAFGNQLGAGFIATDGYGLIDARKAVEQVLGAKPLSTGITANLSTRSLVDHSLNSLIGGVIIQGTGAKRIIIRAIGPSLPVPNVVADPALELFDANGQQLAQNDNWQDDPTEADAIRSTGIPPNDPREAAIVTTLAPGNYTAVVRALSTFGGNGLVEVYDLDVQPAPSRLANIATRGAVVSGDEVMIAGFILQQATTDVVVRALGPSLEASGIPGFLRDPALELYDSQGNLLSANDNWQQSAFQAVQLAAVGLGPQFPLESAVRTSLSPGPYTAIVRPAQGIGGGIGLIEVYSLR